MSTIAEAKKICPDIVIVSGEDLTRFRDVSKDLYNFLQEFVWSKKVEKLGLDEVSTLDNDLAKMDP
jgi:DNA polymerase iota